jgi:hypothetical protein
VVQEPPVGPIEPLHALAVGAWLRATEAGGSLEGAIREARVPSRFLLAGVVVLSVLVLLPLMRVGPGTGAATGTVLAIVLALGALALAWGVPARPALRWLPLVAAVGGWRCWSARWPGPGRPGDG